MKILPKGAWQYLDEPEYVEACMRACRKKMGRNKKKTLEDRDCYFEPTSFEILPFKSGYMPGRCPPGVKEPKPISETALYMMLEKGYATSSGMPGLFIGKDGNIYYRTTSTD